MSAYCMSRVEEAATLKKPVGQFLERDHYGYCAVCRLRDAQRQDHVADLDGSNRCSGVSFEALAN
jgi:hypothetical protein